MYFLVDCTNIVTFSPRCNGIYIRVNVDLYAFPEITHLFKNHKLSTCQYIL